MTFPEGTEDDENRQNFINRPKSSGKDPAKEWKMTPAIHQNVDYMGTSRRPGRDAASGSSQSKTAETASEMPEPPSGQAMNVEPKTYGRSKGPEQLKPQTADAQEKMDYTEPLSTFETADQESVRPEAPNVVISRSPPPTAPSFSGASPTRTSTPRSSTSCVPQSSLESHGRSIRGAQIYQGNVLQPQSTRSLEQIPEVADEEDIGSPNSISPPVDFAAMYHMNQGQTSNEGSSASDLHGQPERSRDSEASKQPRHQTPNPPAERRPSSRGQTTQSSRGSKEAKDNAKANRHPPAGEKDRYRVSKPSSIRRADVLPSSQGQPAGRRDQRAAGSLPTPNELIELLKFTLSKESEVLMQARITKYEKGNNEERARHREELRKMQLRLDSVASERDGLKASIEERRRELGEREKAFGEIERAKRKIEAQAAEKDRAISNQKESIVNLEKQLGAAQKDSNVAGILEQSCLPLKSGIDGIRSQLEVLLNDRNSNQDTSEILKNIRQIQMSGKGLSRDFIQAHKICASIDISEKETRGSTEAISSLKEFFSAEIKTISQEISSQQEMQEQCSELRKENAALAERNSSFQERATDIERRLQASSNSKETLQQTVEELKDEVSREKAAAAMSSDDRQRLRGLEADAGRLTSDLEASRSELQLKRDELEARCKSEKGLQARIAVLQKEGASTGSERLKKEYEKKVEEVRRQSHRDVKEAVLKDRAKYKNELRGYKETAERATAELDEVTGPDSRLKKLEHERIELNRQLSELEAKNSTLTSKESTSTAELSALRCQAEGLRNEVQEANEKAVGAEKSRQETQSELEKTKEALREASSSAQRVEELGEQIRTLTEEEKALRKELEEADNVAANRHARDEMDLEDDWIVAVFEVELKLEKSSNQCHEAEAEAWQFSNECRQLREENKKLHQQLEAFRKKRTAPNRIQSSDDRDQSPVVDTPPATKTPAPNKPRKKVDRSEVLANITEQSHAPSFVPSTLSRPQGQTTSQQSSGPSNGLFESAEQVMVPQTSTQSLDEYGAFDEFIVQNGTQVVPATFPNWTANDSDEATGVFSHTLAGLSQPADRVSSSHSEFQDLYQEPAEEVSLIDRASELPATPRLGKSVMIRDERPRSRANTGRRLSQIASSDGQVTPLASKSQLDSQQPINLNNFNVEDGGSPDFMKPPSKNAFKTYGKHNASERGGNSQSRPNSQSSSTSMKRPASQSARETESQKRVRQVEVISLSSQTTDTQESNRPGPARTLYQSTHVSDTQFPSQLRPQSYSQSQSQASSPAYTRMRSSQGRSNSMTGPSQSVRNRRRASGSQMNERFSQETRR